MSKMLGAMVSAWFIAFAITVISDMLPWPGEAPHSEIDCPDFVPPWARLDPTITKRGVIVGGGGQSQMVPIHYCCAAGLELQTVKPWWKRVAPKKTALRCVEVE